MRNIVYSSSDKLILLSKKLLNVNRSLAFDFVADVVAILIGGLGFAIVIIYELFRGEKKVEHNDIDYYFYINENEEIREAYCKGQQLYTELISTLEEDGYLQENKKVENIISKIEMNWPSYDSIYKLEKEIGKINKNSKSYELIKTVDITYEGPIIIINEHKKNLKP